MGPFGAVKSVLSNAFTFSGRASRSEYWWWGLIYFGVGISLGYADYRAFEARLALGQAPIRSLLDFNSLIFVILAFFPNLSVTVRRLHDTDRSGWWQLITMVPFIGGIWFLVLMVFPLSHGPNRFGPPPSNGRLNGMLEIDSRFDAASLNSGKTQIHPAKFQPAPAGSAQAQKNAFRAYLTLENPDQGPSEEAVAARKAEMRSYYESRVVNAAR
ncbi:MAG: DUF805 domain-containing protein [Shimia sp.]|jgi:uncharacterized membrane protein YhaH (DUF805 family)|uniref:DUF805 domain-containing protein n=1 Tax=Shimia sp. TaxID=1954381 RepID=UPI0040596A17